MISRSKFIPQIAYDSVRNYQEHALDSTIDYIENFDTHKGTSHLVAMPTGSGKTAIMALLAGCHGPMEGIVLIVGPRIAVSKQLIKEIG